MLVALAATLQHPDSELEGVKALNDVGAFLRSERILAKSAAPAALTALSRIFPKLCQDTRKLAHQNRQLNRSIAG